MSNAHAERQARRPERDQEELAERTARALPHDGPAEPQPGLHFRRHSRPTERVDGFCAPAFCVIAQDSNDILPGHDAFRYDPAHYVISTMEFPLFGEVGEASPGRTS